MVNETDKKSVSFASTGSNPVDVFCFNFYFFPSRKNPNPGDMDRLHRVVVGMVLIVYNTSIDMI